MKRALIKNGKIVSYTDNAIAAALTEHRYANVIEADKPTYDSKTHSLNRIVEIGDDVNVSWVKVPISRSDIESRRISGIKSKASELILSVEQLNEITKQLNMIARVLELKSLATMTTEEQAEHDGAEKLWGFIKAVREYSNDMEDDEDKPNAEDGTWPTLN